MKNLWAERILTNYSGGILYGSYKYLKDRQRMDTAMQGRYYEKKSICISRFYLYILLGFGLVRATGTTKLSC